MNIFRSALALLALSLFPGPGIADSLLGITHYALDLHLFPDEERMEAVAILKVENNSPRAVSSLPFLLYRLMIVKSVIDAEGRPMVFEQTLARLAEEPNFHVNQLVVKLAKPLAPGAALEVALTYSGTIYGYEEVMKYVKDRISESYSLIRPDALAYPMLATPAWASLTNAYRTSFTYDLTVRAPAGYVVACGGNLISVADEKGTAVHTFRSKIPTWRMDIAIAKFRKSQDESARLAVYALAGDESGAATVLKGMKRVIDVYSKLFGPPASYQGYTAIEIPDGWGSQAADYYFLQTAAAFRDSKNMREVYHEIAHTWNAKAKPGVDRCRWFDEAFASYFEALALREIDGQEAFVEELGQLRDIFVSRAAKDPKNAQIPIADYGSMELGDNSYTKGAWALYVLHALTGEDTFREIIATFLTESRGKQIDFHDFQRTAERVSARDLTPFFEEWIYGTESSRLLQRKLTVEEIAQRY